MYCHCSPVGNWSRAALAGVRLHDRQDESTESPPVCDITRDDGPILFSDEKARVGILFTTSGVFRGCNGKGYLAFWRLAVDDMLTDYDIQLSGCWSWKILPLTLSHPTETNRVGHGHRTCTASLTSGL